MFFFTLDIWDMQSNTKKSSTIPKGDNQNPSIMEEQAVRWLKEKEQNNKH